MGEEQVGGAERRGRRRSRAEAEQVVAAYEASGLSRTGFSRRHGMTVATLDQYRKRQRQGEALGGAQLPAPRLLEVELARPEAEGESAGGLAVVLSGGRRVEVSRGFDAATLERLLSCLRLHRGEAAG